ncbi:hypothetical protein TruAng_006152 [Truncatella angustata]|nr:hypothetical protein TruAng_006152 [Truncatella angustata]
MTEAREDSPKNDSNWTALYLLLFLIPIVFVCVCAYSNWCDRRTNARLEEQRLRVLPNHPEAFASPQRQVRPTHRRAASLQTLFEIPRTPRTSHVERLPFPPAHPSVTMDLGSEEGDLPKKKRVKLEKTVPTRIQLGQSAITSNDSIRDPSDFLSRPAHIHLGSRESGTSSKTPNRQQAAGEPRSLRVENRVRRLRHRLRVLWHDMKRYNSQLMDQRSAMLDGLPHRSEDIGKAAGFIAKVTNETEITSGKLKDLGGKADQLEFAGDILSWDWKPVGHAHGQ